MTLRVVVVVALALLFWKFAPVLLLAFGGVLVSIFLRTIGDWVSKWTGISAVWSLAIVLGKILSMIVVGVLTTTGLWIIGVPLALALGVIAALLTFVPNFGPILSALPAILLAFVDSPMRALYVFLLYFGIQTVESYLITPLIQQKTVSLPPALTISTQISLGILFGAGGVVFATPLTAAALVLLKRLYVEDMLEAE